MHRVRFWGRRSFGLAVVFLGDDARHMMPLFWVLDGDGGHHVPLLPCCILARGRTNWQSVGGLFDALERDFRGE